MRALETNGTQVVFEVMSGGTIKDQQGINLPGVRVSIPSMTEKDCADLEFGLSQNVDMVALSFVRTAADVAGPAAAHEEAPRARCRSSPRSRSRKALDNLEGILAESDGVMVARGDLGVEMALARVPGAQKTIIERARIRGKFVITATQMLESMIREIPPTRAEVNDVANAIFDGTDAVMLSAETASGAVSAGGGEDDGDHRRRSRSFPATGRFRSRRWMQRRRTRRLSRKPRITPGFPPA